MPRYLGYLDGLLTRVDRHGWGCEPDPEGAIKYLSAAASNAATVEQMALKAGLKKGGAAKGELVLAIFELANSFRHGWGTAKDPIAAKQVSSSVHRTEEGGGRARNALRPSWPSLEGLELTSRRHSTMRLRRTLEILVSLP